MKIAIISTVSSGSGADRQALHLYRGFAERGHEVFLVAGEAVNVEAEEAFITRQTQEKIYQPIGGYEGIMEELDPDVVLFTTFGRDIFKSFNYLKKHQILVYRMTANYLELLTTQGFPQQIPQLLQFLDGLDHLIIPHEFLVSNTTSLGVDREKISIISNAVPEGKIKRSYCEDPTILTSGRLAPMKNTTATIQALALVKEEVPEAELGISGNGGFAPVFKRLVRELMLDDSVKFTGYVDDINDLFQEASVYVQPSLTEKMSNSVMEAMMAGLPCVLSDVGGNSMFPCPKVPHDDVRGLADEIVRLLQNQEYKEAVVRRQDNWLEKQPNFNEVMDKYENMLQELVEEKGVFKV